MNKKAASVAQFAKCILLHAYSRTTAAFSCTQKLYTAYLTTGITVFLVIN